MCSFISPIYTLPLLFTDDYSTATRQRSIHSSTFPCSPVSCSVCGCIDRSILVTTIVTTTITTTITITSEIIIITPTTITTISTSLLLLIIIIIIIIIWFTPITNTTGIASYSMGDSDRTINSSCCR